MDMKKFCVWALRFKPIVLICVVVFLVASVTLSVSKGFTFMGHEYGDRAAHGHGFSERG